MSKSKAILEHENTCPSKDHLANIDVRMARIEEVLNRTFEQTTKTNGRVNAIEAWKNKVVGALAIILTCGGVGAYALTVYSRDTAISAVKETAPEIARTTAQQTTRDVLSGLNDKYDFIDNNDK